MGATKPTAKKLTRRDWRPLFLKRYTEHSNVTAAAKLAGVHRTTVYDERERNPEFAAQFDEVRAGVVDRLEQIAIERAPEDPSPTLLIFLLKCLRPEVYGQGTQQQHQVTINGTIANETHHHITASHDIAAILKGLAETNAVDGFAVEDDAVYSADANGHASTGDLPPIQ